MKPKPNRLREIRQKAGITLADLARESGITEKTIRKIERREGNSRPETRRNVVRGLQKLAKARGIDDIDFRYQSIFDSGD